MSDISRIHLGPAREVPLPDVPATLHARLLSQGLRHLSARRAGNPPE